jgi:hypothetical protein
MCGPTSETQYRVIEKSSEEEIMFMTQEFVTAEAEYRLDRAANQYARPARRRHRVTRRPTLHLPHPRRRPLSLA